MTTHPENQRSVIESSKELCREIGNCFSLTVSSKVVSMISLPSTYTAKPLSIRQVKATFVHLSEPMAEIGTEIFLLVMKGSK